MNRAVLLSLIALLGLHQGVIEVQAEPKPLLNDTSRWESSLVESTILIFKLYERLEKVKERLKTKPVDIESILRKVENAVDRLEGTGCTDKEVQCGSIEQQCVSKLLICDGVKDCVNGHDEDPSYCDVSHFRAGTSFSGWFPEGTCMKGSRRNMYFCKGMVTSVTRNFDFPSLLPIKTIWTCTLTVLGVSVDGEELDKFIFTGAGHYEIANRRWITVAGDYTDYCQFTDYNFQVMRCDTYMGLTDRCTKGLSFHRVMNH